jgi:hypothetical protein
MPELRYQIGHITGIIHGRLHSLAARCCARAAAMREAVQLFSNVITEVKDPNPAGYRASLRDMNRASHKDKQMDRCLCL